MDWWVDGLMDGWVDEWVDSSIYGLQILIYTHI